MKRCSFCVVWVFMLSVVVMPTLGQESNPVAETSNLSEAVRVERILSAMELVLDHHLDPPTRQEMLLSAARTLMKEAKRKAPPGLSRRVSDLENREHCAAFLVNLMRDAQATGLSREEAEAALSRGAVAVVPGRAEIMAAKEAKVQQQLQSNQYVGIGITLSAVEGMSSIGTAIPGGPAAKAGALDGDLFEFIDGKPTKGLGTHEVVDLLRGPEGTQVTVVFKRILKTLPPMTITRGIVPLETVHGLRVAGNQEFGKVVPQNFHAEPGSSIAYVQLDRIGGSSVHELRQIEQRLRADKMQALIIDLRLLHSDDPHYAVLLADALLSKGAIGRVRHGDHTREFTADADCLFQDWPLAVLVSEGTAGTAEWLAAALQDNQRAIIVGSPTSGDAYVSTTFPIPNSDKTLTIPTGILERPSGKPLYQELAMRSDVEKQRGRSLSSRQYPWGVHPDVVVGEPRPNGVAIQRLTNEVLQQLRSKGRSVQPVVDALPLAIEQLQKRLTRAAESADKFAPSE